MQVAYRCRLGHAGLGLSKKGHGLGRSRQRLVWVPNSCFQRLNKSFSVKSARSSAHPTPHNGTGAQVILSGESSLFERSCSPADRGNSSSLQPFFTLSIACRKKKACRTSS